VEITVFDPDEFLSRAFVRVFRVDAGHTVRKLDAGDLETFLVGQENAEQVLLVVAPVNHRLLALAILAWRQVDLTQRAGLVILASSSKNAGEGRFPRETLTILIFGSKGKP